MPHFPSQYPACGDTLDSVIEDIQLISQLTTRLRLYGADCNVPSLVLEAIEKTKVNMTVFLATWVPQSADDPDGSTYQRQVSEVQKAIQTFGVDHVDGVTVGNEVSGGAGQIGALEGYPLICAPPDSSCSTMAPSRSSLRRWPTCGQRCRE